MSTTHDVLGELMRGSLDHCVKCTICETFCPVSNVTPLFPGPKYVGPQAERFRTGEESPDQSLDYCSSCGVCTQVCPQGVHIAEINSQARAKLKQRTGFKLRDRLLVRPDLGGQLGTPVAPLTNWALHNRATRAVGDRVLGLHRDAALPSYAGRTFQRWARRHTSPPGAGRVAYFHGCGANWYEPHTGEMAVALLERTGCQVEVPRGQRCCGLPAAVQRHVRRARGYVHRLSGALAPAADAGLDIVGTSTSCTLMLKREAREILRMEDDPQLRRVSDRIFDICEYLLALHDRGELRTDFQELPLTVTYHAPCQQQGHGIGKPALDLMALVPGLRVIENDATCCGVAGHVRAEEGEVRHRDEGRRGPVRADRRRAARSRRVRLGDLPVAHREGDRRALGPSDRDPAPRRGSGVVRAR